MQSGDPETKAVVFIWDNFGPTHVDRAEAVAAAVAPMPVVGIELSRKSVEYDWVSETGSGFRKVNLPREDGAWPQRALRIVRTVMKARPAVVFSCHYERLEIMAAVVILRLLGVRIFTMIDSKFDDYQRFLWREVLKRLFFLPYSGAIVGSRRAAEYLRFLGFRPDHLMQGYDAISIKRIQQLSGTEPAPAGAPFAERHFTIVARLVPKKNIATAIRAFAKLRADGSTRRLVICGSGPLADELRAETIALGVDTAVTFKGFVQTADVARILGSTLALIQPSVEEQFGIAVAEAVAMGLPVLVSENCGARDALVRTAVNGFVFEPDNVDGLAAVMKRIDSDPDLWRAMAESSNTLAPLADTTVFADSVRRLCGMSVYPTPTTLAPIAVFAYRRAELLERCLDALEQCPEFAASKVYVFVDGPRNEAEAEAVYAVRDLVRGRLRPNMTVVARETNRGLANSIIAEVTDLVGRYGRIIVIEDDLVVEPTALSWLNQSLEIYKNDPRVMQVSAYQYRTPEFGDRLTGNFQHFTTTWGWATWKRAWDAFDPEAEGWQQVATPGPARKAFDAGGTYPFSDMLVSQMCGELDSWGIRWSWSMHKARGMTLMPPRSLVRNEGMNESATNNSVGWLKPLVSGPRPKIWNGEHPPQMPGVVKVDPDEQRVFRRGLRRTNANRNATIKKALSALGFPIASTRVRHRMHRVIAVAQLPPPVTGLSVVNDRVIATLRSSNLLFSAINAAAPADSRGVAKAAKRLSRTLWAAYCISQALYRRATTLYLPCDGGFGQLYNLMLILGARAGRFDLWLHHHSFAYVNRRSRLMALLMRQCPIGTRHIFLCSEMRDRFVALYDAEWRMGMHEARLLSNAFTVSPSDHGERSDDTLAIGHLSNLTVEKGSLRFIDLFRRLSASGVRVRAEMAGPAQDDATAEAIRAAAVDYPLTFKWHGPLGGDAKDAFYKAIDVFVLPTRYVNEAQPVVLLEALAHGCAVAVPKRGCIACDHAGSPGLVADDDYFDEAAFAWLSALTPEHRRVLPEAAREAFRIAKAESESQLSAILAEITVGKG